MRRSRDRRTKRAARTSILVRLACFGYARRWTYTPPWGSTRWALPAVRYFRGGDEYCNDTLLIQVPFLGHVTFWKPWGELRTTRCDQCVADGFGDDDD